MEDLRKKVHDGRSLLEKIGKIIPGYSGYKKKLERQEADKLLRDYLVQQMNQVMDRLKDLLDELSRGMKLKFMDGVDRPLKNLEKLRDRIKYADHGYTGWFEPAKIDTAVLDRIYEFDAALIDRVEALKALIGQALQDSGDDDKLSAALKTLQQEVSDQDAQFYERENFIIKSGNEGAE